MSNPSDNHKNSQLNPADSTSSPNSPNDAVDLTLQPSQPLELKSSVAHTPTSQDQQSRPDLHKSDTTTPPYQADGNEQNPFAYKEPNTHHDNLAYAANSQPINTPINPYQSPSTPLTNSHTMSELENANTWHHLSGRIGRLRYLSYQLVIAVVTGIASFILTFIVGLISGFVGINDPDAVSILVLIITIPLSIVNLVYSLAIYPKRRLHDLGHSGWLALILLIPLINLFFILYLIFARGQEGINQYGAPPRENRPIHYIAGIIAPVLFFVMILGILAAIAIPAYQDYIKRAQMDSIAHEVQP